MEAVFTEVELQELSRCKVYSYQGKKVKTHTQVLLFSVLFIIPIAIGFGFIMSMELVDQGILSLCFLGAFIIMVAYIVKVLQIDAMNALTQYFVDAVGDCYKIQFTKVSTKVLKVKRQYSLVPLVGEVNTLIDAIEKLKCKEEYMAEAYEDARDKALGYYYVSRFKQGIKDWNWYSGGEAKVILLGKEEEVRIPKNYA